MEFLNPNVLYLMLMPLLLLFILIITSKSSIQKHFSKEVLEKLRVGTPYLSKKSRNIMFFLILILFIIALSRPVINKKEQKVQQSLIPIVIALDVSTSMLSEDIYPNRISLAKKKLQKIIEISQNSTIGVVLFAKDSFILSPVTEDFISLKFIVDNLNTDLDFVNGSNIFSTLEATKYMLADYKVKNLIVLSDGGNNNDYEDELEFLKKNDIVLYSIGLATKEGAPIPKDGSYLTNTDGNIVRVKLNESIKNLSLKSGGGYIDFTLDDSDVRAIINRLNIQSKKEELNIQKVKVYTELFYYPLALGLFLLLISFSSFPTFKRKTSISNIFVIGLIFSFVFHPTNTFAYTFNFENIENAKKAYNNKEYEKASNTYRTVSTNNESLYNLGNSLYKEGKYKEAIEVYDKVITTDKELEAKKLHNLGNSYVNINDLEKAQEFYEKSLEIKKDKETKENLEMVKKELEKKKKQDKNNKDDKKNQDNKNKKEEKKEDSKDSEKDNQKSQNQSDQENNQKQEEKKKQEENKNNTDDSKKQDTKNKKSEEKESKQKNKEKKDESKMQGSKENKDELSDMEEKKWMNMLQKNGTPIYMQKVKTDKESSYDKKQPW
ncbi:tetratricopeptide repeat protein [Arcobacteraceae bacterium]|nr:tetratricopeptide repeat protein [Arcobacteraceae bacterium]